MNETARWIEGAILGEFALGLCVIAVAFIGARMLIGRLPLREGARIVVGCFVLLGAPVIARGLYDLGGISSPTLLSNLQTINPATPRPELPKATYNPYAQASVRDDR